MVSDRLAGLDQQHHGTAHLIRHTGQIQHGRIGHSLFHSLQYKAAPDQTHQDLGEGMVLFFDLLAQEEGGAFPGIIVVVHRPADRTALSVPDPVLPYTGSKDRVRAIRE